ncbi:MAG: methyltransferase domain-containing protein [Spirochaetaceae bacterium]
MVKKRTIVIYPHLGTKAGTGHLKRLIPFFSDVRFNVYLIHRDPDFAKEIVANFDIDLDIVYALSDIKKIKETIDLILLDNRASDRYLFDKLKNIAPIVALDEGGDARDYVPYCIDTLPNLLKTEANYFNPGLLDLPENKYEGTSLKKVLITFGGQDPFKLTEQAVDNLEKRYEITTVIGPLFVKKDYGVSKIVNPENLKEMLFDFDLIITSFGITAFEAVSAGVPVVLYNPTDYHRELANKAGFYSIDSKFNINYKKAKKSIKTIKTGKQESLTDFIYNLEASFFGCPICGRKSNPSIKRLFKKSYFRCNHCLLDYMVSHNKKIEYSENYFFDDYQKQYGKTYLEDFDNIKNLGLTRLKWIKKKLKKGDSILDIGCAYGPFLKASEIAGLSPFGIDVSLDAIKYITNNLSLPAINSAFPLDESLDFPTPFNSITMWFVIEHFKNLDDVFIQVNNLLKKGGVFAFSTPNGAGISAKKNYIKFLSNSPDDHYSILSPNNIKKILKGYGFKVYKINITGHHPERFGKLVKAKIIYKIIMLISKVFKLGDTFEVYCVKENKL